MPESFTGSALQVLERSNPEKSKYLPRTKKYKTNRRGHEGPAVASVTSMAQVESKTRRPPEYQEGEIPMHQAFLKLYVFLRSLQHSEEGQDLVEYALLCSLIALTLISGLNQLASTINGFFTAVSSSLA